MTCERRSLISIEVLTLMLFLGSVQALAGQSIAGTLREEGRAGAPLAGAFVSLIDASDVRVDAAFSTGSGAFLLRAPGPGSYRVHVGRIGYADWTSVVYELDRQGPRTVEIAIPREPVVLTTLQVRVTRTCVTNPAEEGALADVWAEARKALETAVWAEGEEELSFDLDEYERVLMPLAAHARRSSRPGNRAGGGNRQPHPATGRRGAVGRESRLRLTRRERARRG